MRRRIGVILSDEHGGNRLGLMNPTVKLLTEDEQGNSVAWTPALGECQPWLWDCHETDILSVIELAAGDDVVVMHNGDITSGVKHPEGLISTREYDQYAIAIANLEPWFEFENVSTMRLMHGTQSHEFGQGTAPMIVAQQLQAQHPDRSISATRHAEFDIDGVIFDVAHHGPTPGIREWTTGNQLRLYTRSLVATCHNRGQRPPDVVARAHYHSFMWETVRWPHRRERKTEAIITPSYCGLSHYGVQATRSAQFINCGMVAVEIVDGELIEIHKFERSVDLRTREVL